MLDKKIAFLTEMGWSGKVARDHTNMRTEFAWMHALDADHHSIWNYKTIKGYDHVFVIFPKGKLWVNAEGTELPTPSPTYHDPLLDLLLFPIVRTLKENNGKVHYVQEGPHWWFNDYDVGNQFLFYNMLFDCDSIFAHNISDVDFYKGLYPEKEVHVMKSLMFDDWAYPCLENVKEDKVIIGGNFARWYGGFQSYIVSQIFDVPIWTQTSHATREYEQDILDVNHLPRLQWNDWMYELSRFKYAVHLMPTVAAGTFALNCAYFGLPCIGNEKVDTQQILYPDLAIDVENVRQACVLAKRLRSDPDFYNHCSELAQKNYDLYYRPETWKENMEKIL